MSKKTVRVECPNRDWVELEYEFNDSLLVVYSQKQFGCYEFVEGLNQFIESMSTTGKPAKYPDGHVGFMLKELHLKLKDEWNLPYNDKEICHCRVVPTENVLNAIRAGADNLQKVSAWTQASTSCGSCAVDVEKILAYYAGEGTDG